MSDRLTKVSSAKGDSGRSDWRRLAALDDIELTVRALDDADTIIATPAELAAFSAEAANEAEFGFRIARSPQGDYRWSLTAADGTQLAVGPEGYASKQEAITAVKSLLFALGNVTGLAA